MTDWKTAVIILAAGRSSRMGEPKPLLPLGTSTLANHIISTFSRNNVEVFLVLGHRRGDILPTITDGTVNIVDNPSYDAGMFTSVQAGARCLASGCERVFVMPVDIPLVRPATIAHLLEESGKYPDKIVYPFFGGRRGHPPLIPSSLIPDILKWQGENGLKGVLSQLNPQAMDLPVPDENILFDVDTPEDYQELKRRFQTIELPSEAERQFLLNHICQTPPNIIAHCRKVVEVALALSAGLQKAGVSVDTHLVRAAAEVHDMRRTSPSHADAAAEALRSYGFGQTANIVAVHMDMPKDTSGVPLEAKVVFLADKLVNGSRIVSIEERFEARMHTTAPEAFPEIIARKQRALAVKAEVEKLLKTPLSAVLDF